MIAVLRRMGAAGVVGPSTVAVQAEWDQLTTVAVVRPTYFRPGEPVNQTQRRYYGTCAQPRLETLLNQHRQVVQAMRNHGVSVLDLPAAPGLPLQFNVRDAGVVVGSRLVLGRMALPVREPEPAALGASVDAVTIEPAAGHLEGGDIIVTPGEIYVGLGERTDRLGATSLGALLAGERAVTPIRLAPQVLHLDVALALLGPRIGLLHRPSIVGELPDSLQQVDWIEVTDEEFDEQGVNVLSLDPQTVLLNARHGRLRRLLTRHGLLCVPVALQEIGKVGGSVRCMTLPLVRLAPPRVSIASNGS